MADGDVLRVSAAGRAVTLDAGRPQLTIGRDPACDIAVDDTRVSRRHVVIRRADGQWVLEDQRSKNGVFRDGERVRRVAVSEPLTVLLGDAVDGLAIELAPSGGDGVCAVPRPERAGPARG